MQSEVSCTVYTFSMIVEFTAAVTAGYSVASTSTLKSGHHLHALKIWKIDYWLVNFTHFTKAYMTILYLTWAQWPNQKVIYPVLKNNCSKL